MEQAGEMGIDGGDNLGPAAVVPAEIMGAFCPSGSLRLLQETLWPRAAEAVDRLGDVADDEQAGRGRQPPDNLVLQRVRVLLFIDQHLVKAAAELACQIGAAAQHQSGRLLEIAEIERGHGPLQFGISGVHRRHEGGEAPAMLLDRHSVLHNRRRRFRAGKRGRQQRGGIGRIPPERAHARVQP